MLEVDFDLNFTEDLAAEPEPEVLEVGFLARDAEILLDQLRFRLLGSSSVLLQMLQMSSGSPGPGKQSSPSWILLRQQRC